MRRSAFLLLLAPVLALVGPSRAQDAPPKPEAPAPTDAGEDSGAAFAVGGIDVDFLGKTADQARLAAWREAQRKAWPLLWSRLSGRPASEAPKLGDPALDAMVSGIEVQSERFSERRYIARLGVIFDRVRAGKYVGGQAAVLTSQPMLLMPVLNDGGVRTVYEQQQSPWLQAWARYRSGTSPMQYVRASTVGGDAILLNAWQARRDNRLMWRSLMNRFRTADVLTAEAKLERAWPGGPVTGTFTARHGPDAKAIGRFTLTASSSGGVAVMLDEAVRRIDGLYTEALRAGQLRSDPSLSVDLAPVEGAGPEIAVAAPADGVEAFVATPSAQALAAVEGALRATPTVTGTRIVSLSLGGMTRISIGHADSHEMLLYSLDQRGWRLQPAQGGLLLRRRQPGDAPVPRPVIVVDSAAAEAPGAAPAVTVTPASQPPAARPAAPAPRPANSGPRDLLPGGGPTP